MFCQKCGKALEAGAAFCKECGTAVVVNSGAALNEKHTASIGLRLANFLADQVIMIVLLILIVIFFSAFLRTVLPPAAENVLTVIIGLIAIFFGGIYYIFFESIWQRTPGKWITKTKVVTLNGGKPTFWRVVGRTLARIIPFEKFSFLVGKYPFGWHDMLSGTMVVPAKYSTEDIRAINPRNRQGSAVWIIILVALFAIVIIIGILLSVVLASLSVAREKAVNATIATEFSKLSTQAELYKKSSGSYLGFCQDPAVVELFLAVGKLGNPQMNQACNDETASWAASSPLKKTGHWCVDSVSSSGNMVSEPPTGTVCSSPEEAGDTTTGSITSRSLPPASTTNQSTQTSQFSTYRSDVDKFSVLFPAEPIVTTLGENIPTGSGNSYDARSYKSSLNPETDNIYYVHTVVYKQSIAEYDASDILDYFIESFIPQGGVLESSSAVDHLGYPAKNFYITVGEEFMRGRLILVGQRLYAPAVRGFAEAYDEVTYKNFISSLKPL